MNFSYKDASMRFEIKYLRIKRNETRLGGSLESYNQNKKSM